MQQHRPLDADWNSFAELEASSRGNQGQFQLVDLRAIIVAVLRNRWIILGAILLAIAVGITATLLSTQRYQAAASLKIDQEADRVLNTESLEPATSWQDAERFLNTQIEILSSRHMAQKVIEDEGLLEEQGFLDAAGIEAGLLNEAELLDAAIAHVRDNVAFRLPQESKIVTITYVDPSSRRAARIANAYAEGLISDNLDRRLASSSYARTYLSDQLAEAKVRLEESERELNNFARVSGVVRLDEGAQSGGGTVTNLSLVQLNEAAGVARAERIAAESRWISAQSVAPALLPEVISSGAYQSIQTERARVLADLHQELAVRQEDHPAVFALRERLAAIDSQAEGLAEQIRSSIQASYGRARAKDESISRQLAALKDELLKEQAGSVSYGILAREVDTNRELYDGLLQRFKEIDAEAGVTSNNISLVDVATAPLRPAYPNVPLNLLISIVVGLCLAGGATYIREILDDRIRTPQDVGDRFGLGVLGAIPLHNDDHAGDITEAMQDPKSAVAEAVHSLRTGVMLSLAGAKSKSLFVTSAEPSEGKSTTTLGLARDIARLGRRTLIVDADLRRPRLHKLFDLPNKSGFSDILAGTAELNEVANTLDPSGVHFLSAGSTVADPASVLNSDGVGEFITELEGNYDFVIFDGPPVLGLADAPTMATKTGAVMFVIQSGRGRASRVKIALGRLRNAHANILGAVLTKVDMTKEGYGYGYGYTDQYYEYRSED